MTTTSPERTSGYECPARMLDGLGRQDFTQLRETLDDGARLRALVSRGLIELGGADAVTDQFRHWFGDTEDFELLNARSDEIAGRLHLSWRIALRAARLGDGWRLVEQQTYVDCAEDGRVRRLDLLCTGYLPVRKDPRT